MSLDRSSRFYQSLLAPIEIPIPTPSILQCLNPEGDNEETYDRAHGQTLDLETIFERGVEHSDAVEVSTSSNLGSSSQPHNDKVIAEPLWALTERWKWIKDQEIVDEDEVFLPGDAMCSYRVKTARIANIRFRYICKAWHTIHRLDESFFVELALYKKYMDVLRGDVVPSIITVLTGPCTLNVAMEPIHHSFWIESSADMPLILKQRCIDAYEKLHSCGVLHGDVELRHMLINGDGKVILINFHRGRVLDPTTEGYIRPASPGELRREMRKVKVVLDYPGAREMERKRISEPELVWAQHQLREYPSYRSSIPELSGDREWDAPFDLKEYHSWINPKHQPCRFLMPGQSTSDVVAGVRWFLEALYPELKQEVSHLVDEAFLPRPSVPPTRKRCFDELLDDGNAHLCKRIRNSEGSPFSDVGPRPTSPSPSEPILVSSSGKRSFGTQTEPTITPSKRRRLNSEGSLPNCALSDPIKPLSTPAYPPNLRGHVYKTGPVTTTPTSDMIQMHNLGQCAAEQLPHPTLLELFPKHPRWQKPDVQLFLIQRLRARQQKASYAIANPNKMVPMPPELRSRGSLVRKLRKCQQAVSATSSRGEGGKAAQPLLSTTCTTKQRSVRFVLPPTMGSDADDAVRNEISSDSSVSITSQQSTALFAPWCHSSCHNSFALFREILRPLWYCS